MTTSKPISLNIRRTRHIFEHANLENVVVHMMLNTFRHSLPSANVSGSRKSKYSDQFEWKFPS